MKKIREVAILFLKLGCFAFGGPAAHIAMMEDEVVEKRKWMDRQHFLDLIGATNLIPGPNSTEIAIHCGYHYAGRLGLLVAGFCFIFPATVFTLILAMIYLKYESYPYMDPFLLGIKPAVIVLMFNAILKLGKKALKSWVIGFIGACVIVLALCGINEILLILLGGLIGAIILGITSSNKGIKCISPLFLVFLKIGSILFGSGYVLIVYLKGELIDRLGWINNQQLIDAIAIGQLTPGPVLSTATFIGYQIQGIKGAILATLGIFLPSFILVYMLNPIVPKLRSNRITAHFLDAVNISAVALMVAVTIRLSQTILLDCKSILIVGICFILFYKVKKVGAVGVVLMGGILGVLLYS